MATDMRTHTTPETMLDGTQPIDAPRGSVAGVFGFVGGLAGVGAGYVALTRQDGVAVAQMAVAAVVCGGIAVVKARIDR